MGCKWVAALQKLHFDKQKIRWRENFRKFFGKLLEIFWLIFEPPRGPKMGPGTPGIDLKSMKKFDFFQKFGPEVSTIFEILIFGFLGVFLMEI